MGVAVGVALEEEVKRAREILEGDLASLQTQVPPENLSDFKKKKEKVKLDFQRDIENPLNQRPSKGGGSHLLSSISKLGLQVEKEKAKGDIKDLRDDLEPLYREIQLIRPDSKVSFVQSLWWMFYRGTLKTLNILQEVESNPVFESEEILSLIKRARMEICQRETADLSAFYFLSPQELQQAIEKMIQNQEDSPLAPLPELFAPETIHKAVVQLEETKKYIEDAYNKKERKKWLLAPNRNFSNLTPKNVILKGKGFRILQHFIRIGEGIS